VKDRTDQEGGSAVPVKEKEVLRAIPRAGIGLEELLTEVNQGLRGRHSRKAEIKALVMQLVKDGRLNFVPMGRSARNGGGTVYKRPANAVFHFVPVGMT
jgi:hypothetical protein